MSAENLELAAEPLPISHRELGRYFVRYDGRRYVPLAAVNERYPDPASVDSEEGETAAAERTDEAADGTGAAAERTGAVTERTEGAVDGTGGTAKRTGAVAERTEGAVDGTEGTAGRVEADGEMAGQSDDEEVWL